MKLQGTSTQARGALRSHRTLTVRGQGSGFILVHLRLRAGRWGSMWYSQPRAPRASSRTSAPASSRMAAMSRRDTAVTTARLRRADPGLRPAASPAGKPTPRRRPPDPPRTWVHAHCHAPQGPLGPQSLGGRPALLRRRPALLHRPAGLRAGGSLAVRVRDLPRRRPPPAPAPCPRPAPASSPPAALPRHRWPGLH